MLVLLIAGQRCREVKEGREKVTMDSWTCGRCGPAPMPPYLQDHGHCQPAQDRRRGYSEEAVLGDIVDYKV